MPAVLLGVWQMLMRSPLPVPFDDSDAYYASVTLHGTAMAYVVTTFFIMGFGYAVAVTSLALISEGANKSWCSPTGARPVRVRPVAGRPVASVA
jgi:cytochrome c oxidase subunit I